VKRVYQIAAALFMAFGLYVVKESLAMNYYTNLGPGSGFFPLWLSLIFTALSGVWFIQSTMAADEQVKDGFFPSKSGVVQVVAIVAAVVIFALVVGWLGFPLTMLVFLFFLIVTLGRQNLALTSAVAIIGSFGIYYLFKNWLDVSLPASSIEFLRELGL